MSAEFGIEVKGRSRNFQVCSMNFSLIDTKAKELLELQVMVDDECTSSLHYACMKGMCHFSR